MPWGKHEGTILKDVPPAYLLWLLEQTWIRDWPGLHAYIKKNEDTLIEERGEPEEDGDDQPDAMRSYDDYLKDYRGF